MRTHFLTTGSMLLLLFCTFSSCRKDNKADTEIVYVIRSNANVIPSDSAVDSEAYGSIYGGFNPNTGKLVFNISWNELSSSATGATLFIVSPNGESQSVRALDVTQGATNGVTAGEVYLSNTEARQLLQGNWYYTVNSQQYPLGEIKGEVVLLNL